MVPSYEPPLWRGPFTNEELHALHAEAFATRIYDESEWDWRRLVERWSLGWVVARRSGGELAGFANVSWDGFTHAYLQDVMVAAADRHHGIGRDVVAAATEGARQSGCEWLHVDFEPPLAPFYLEACGFTATGAGLLALAAPPIANGR